MEYTQSPTWRKNHLLVAVFLLMLASQFHTFFSPTELLRQTSVNNTPSVVATNNATLSRIERLEKQMEEATARLDHVLALLEDKERGLSSQSLVQEELTSSPLTTRPWNPQRFSTPFDLTNNLQRGMHFMTAMSGCRMASWTYVASSEEDTKTIKKWLIELYKDCQYISLDQQKLTNQSSPALVQEHDTVYVTFSQLPHFVKHFLPKIKVDFVLITGQWQKESFPISEKNEDTLIPDNYVQSIVTNPHVLHWFCQNLEFYIGSRHTKYPNKIHSFPYGLKGEGSIQNWTVPTFKRVFLASLHNNHHNKTNLVHAGYVRKGLSNRKGIPASKKLALEPYLQAIANSQYVLSPDGDRPECYRHYEAIGLGAVPITQLDPAYYAHFQSAILYQQTQWDLDHLEATLPPVVRVDRNMIFEEYWMEYVERIANVGPLRWFDRVKEERARISDFVMPKTKS